MLWPLSISPTLFPTRIPPILFLSYWNTCCFPVTVFFFMPLYLYKCYSHFLESKPHTLPPCNLTNSYPSFKINSSLPEFLSKAESSTSLTCSHSVLRIPLAPCFHTVVSWLTFFLCSEHLKARVCLLTFLISNTELDTCCLANVEWMNEWTTPCLPSKGPSEYQLR